MAEKETPVRAKKDLRFSLKGSAISKNSKPESVEKNDVIRSLKIASAKCNKRYSKGKIAFMLLEEIDPNKVISAMPWAKRLVDHVTELQGT